MNNITFDIKTMFYELLSFNTQQYAKNSFTNISQL